MSHLRIGSITWNLVDATFGVSNARASAADWSLTAQMIDANRRRVGPFMLAGYARPSPRVWSDLGSCRLTTTVEDPADVLAIGLDGRTCEIAPFGEPGAEDGVLLRVEQLSADKLCLSYAGPFLVLGSDGEDEPIDAELFVEARIESIEL